MPLAMLVTAAPQGADDDPAALRGTAWLADRFTLAELPSLQSLAFLRKFKAKPGTRKGAFIGIGDPALAGAPQDTGSRRGAVRGLPVADLYEKDPMGGTATLDVERLRKLPSLPGTGRELKAMASALSLGDDVLRLRENASESTIKSLDLSGYGVVTFATHGLLAGELGPGQEPGLVFTPPAEASAADNGLLTPEEVARLKLSADWVILSACNTAGGDGSDGAPALSGLARSFFYAGARSLLVSHWPVRDDVAAKMTVRALQIRSLDPDISRAEAFQKAQREIRKSPVADGVVTTTDGRRYENSWAHPNAWAPFVLIGDVSE
jgi:CHAT domain-containing protein